LAGALSWNVPYTGSRGNDRFSGGAGPVVVDMGLGNDKVATGPSADTVILRAGTSRVDTGEGGDTILLDPNYGLTTLSVTGGTGNDVLRIASFASTADITLGAMSLEHAAATGYLTVNFNDKLDRIELNDTAAETRLKTVSMDWASTDFSLNASGSVNVTGTSFKAADGLLSISAQRFVGTFNTQVAELSLQARDAAFTSDLVVNERDSLRLVSDRWNQGGLVTASGRLAVTLANAESTLTLASGRISAGAGGEIRLVADDIDFVTGRDKVSGTGLLSITVRSAGQDMRVGGAAQIGRAHV
jgi:hypothetical protein